MKNNIIIILLLQEGPVRRVTISPDERAIALATSRGNVFVVIMKPTIKLVANTTEHIHQRITSLCWNDTSNEVYIGDENGKISAMMLSSFAVG